MNAAPDLQFRAYTRSTLPTAEAAASLLECFVDAGEPLVPTRYAGFEPIRTPFDPADLSAPAAMLSSKPWELLLGRSKPSYNASLSWTVGRQRPWIWSIRFERGWGNGKACPPDRLVQFFLDLCTKFPPVFAACASGGDWVRKHTVRDRATGVDLGTRGLTLNPGEGLPGVYWFNFFGPELTSFFGRDRLLTLPAHQILDRGASGIGVVVRDAPEKGSPEQRLDQEKAIVGQLGEEYFFDLEGASRQRPRRRTPIPGATDHR